MTSHPKTLIAAGLMGLLTQSCAAIPLSDSRATIVSFDKFLAGIEESNLFSGGPEERFVGVGRGSLATAIESGLMPDDVVLDVGAGVLRVGWWLLQYIEPSNYYVIEPNRKAIDTATGLIGVDINVYYNSDFEFPDLEFDFVFARSMWTHTSKAMISKMLSEFAENSVPDAKFLTSVAFPKQGRPDYVGERWRKIIVGHSLSWIEEECRKNGLSVQVNDELYNQTWLLIEHTSAPSE